VAEDAHKKAETLSAAFATLAEGAAQGGTLSLIRKTVAAYGTFARLNGEIARYAASMSAGDGPAAGNALGTLQAQIGELKTYAVLGNVGTQYQGVVAEIDAFKKTFQA